MALMRPPVSLCVSSSLNLALDWDSCESVSGNHVLLAMSVSCLICKFIIDPARWSQVGILYSRPPGIQYIQEVYWLAFICALVFCDQRQQCLQHLDKTGLLITSTLNDDINRSTSSLQPRWGRHHHQPRLRMLGRALTPKQSQSTSLLKIESIDLHT